MPDEEITLDPTLDSDDFNVKSNVYKKRTVDILFEVKQTRVCIKKA